MCAVTHRAMQFALLIKKSLDEAIGTQQSACEATLYGVCGSRNYRRFGLRATDVKNGNAGPKLHWLTFSRLLFVARTNI